MTTLLIQELKHIQELDTEDINQGRSSGIKENVKQKIVVPLLKLLDYNIEKDMDFEHHVESKKADIALLVHKQPKIIVECKSYEKNLDKHIEQAIEYAEKKAIPYVILTNGAEFRLYKTFIENVVNPKDRMLISIKREKLTEQFNELADWVSRKSIISETLDKKSEERALLIGQAVTAPTLIQHLKEAKKILREEAKKKIPSIYAKNKIFKKHVEEWAESNEFDLKEEDWIDRLSGEIAYSFITRLYFYRIAEDNEIVQSRLSRGELSRVLKYFDPNKLLKVCWEDIWQIDYHAIFRETFFDTISFDDETIRGILFRLTNYNFSKISYDILGKVYQEHISREERKELGQYYTPDWIVKFILSKIPISIHDKITDPACGSGTFLIHAYEILKEKYLEQDYDENAIHNMILQTNIFGKDINPLAVQLTATNLALKNLKKKTDALNIIPCDSLSSDLQHYMETLRFDIDAQQEAIIADHVFPKKYNVIIGNPPYFIIKQSTINKRYPTVNYSPVTQGRTNIASLFLKKYIDQLEDEGYLGFVIPKSITYVEPWSDIREYILKNCQIVCMYDLKAAFDSVLLEQVVLILKKTSEVSSKARVEIYYKEKINADEIETHYDVPHSYFTKELFPFYLTKLNENLWNKLKQDTIPLSKVADITRGIGIQSLKGEFSEKRRSKEDVRIIAGKDIGKYHYRATAYINPDREELKGYHDKIKRLLVEKVVAQNIVAQTKNHIKVIANYDSGESINLDTVTNIIPLDKKFSTKYLLAIINSKLASYFLYNIVYNRSVRTMHLEYIKHLPIKEPTEKECKNIETAVDKLLSLHQKINTMNTSMKGVPKFDPEHLDDQKSMGTATKQIAEVEAEIDMLIYKLYKLTPKEIAEIKNQV